ncbi:hypothetical protein D3C87_259540 [compost metagenome]
MKLAACFAALTLWTSLSLAQQTDLLERSFSGVSKATTPVAARKDIQEQASLKVSEEVIKELIGEERFSRNRTLILNRIIKNSGRYIPFSKPSELKTDSDGYKMSVAMKISLRDLKQLLQTNSLLSENDATPVVLPLISWVNRVEGKSYRWWQGGSDENIFLIKEGRRFEDALRSSFQKNGFYVIKPSESGIGKNLPSDFQTEKVNSDDAQFFAQYYNAPLLVDGQVTLEKGSKSNKYAIEIRLTAIQVSNNRAIADVSRKFETDSGSFETVVDKRIKEVVEAASNDLTSQVFEAWQRGSIGTSVIRVTVKGKSTLPLMENFKNKIRTQITQVKNIRERVVTSDFLSFEVDTSVSSAELMTKLEALNMDGKKLSKVSESSNEIVLMWTE